MKNPALALILGLPAAFAAGWWLRPSSGRHFAETRLPAGTSPGDRSFPTPPPKLGVTQQVVASPPAEKARPFPKGGAKSWLRSLGGVETIQDSAAADALLEALRGFTADEFAELDQAVLQALKDPSLKSSQRKFAIRLLFLAWPEWVRVDPAATLTSMNWAYKAGGQDFLAGNTVQTIFRRYAALNLEEAIAAIDRLPESSRKDAGHGVMVSAALEDPFAALEMIPRLGANASGDPRAIVDAAVQRDPVRAAALTGPVAGDAPRDNTFLRAMEKWSEVDPVAAAAWIASYQGPGRVTGLTAVLAAQTKTDAEGAAAKLLTIENPGQSPYTPRLAETIAWGLFAKSGPQAALEWATQLPEQLQEPAAGKAVALWAEKDATAASQWVTGQPAGPTRDSAAVALINSIKSSDPASAWEWAKSLSDQEKSGAALAEVDKQWRQQDVQAAKAALESLSPNLRSAMEEKQPQRR